MSASEIGPTHRSLPHFMLHRNIAGGRIRAARDSQTCSPGGGGVC